MAKSRASSEFVAITKNFDQYTDCIQLVQGLGRNVLELFETALLALCSKRFRRLLGTVLAVFATKTSSSDTSSRVCWKANSLKLSAAFPVRNSIVQPPCPKSIRNGIASL
jgi:hypothetical protein